MAVPQRMIHEITRIQINKARSSFSFSCFSKWFPDQVMVDISASSRVLERDFLTIEIKSEMIIGP